MINQGSSNSALLPEAARLHKGAKAADRVAVYPTRNVTPWLARVRQERIHRAEQIAVQLIDAALVTQLTGAVQQVELPRSQA